MTTRTKDTRTAIGAADDRFEAAYGAGDAAAMAELYTQDGMLLPTDSDFVRGEPAIQQFCQGVVDMGIEEVELEILEIEAPGETAIEIGRYPLSGEGEIVDRGKYTVIWKRVEGAWKLHRDIWKTSTPQKSEQGWESRTPISVLSSARSGRLARRASGWECRITLDPIRRASGENVWMPTSSNPPSTRSVRNSPARFSLPVTRATVRPGRYGTG